MGSGSTYDVFLSHCGIDKPEVELLATRLQRETGLRPFLDRYLVPGGSWQPELELAIECSSTAAIFFGPHGKGPWHTEEMQVLLDKAARSRNDFRVIPVLLPGASAEAIDVFLKQRTWVDFRSGLDDQSAFQRLVAGIKGDAIEPDGYELPDKPAPYRGLERFEAPQKDFFFGREDDIRRLAKRLASNRFVAIVGASGCGKSSLARAGLQTVVASQELPSIRDWQLITFLPGQDPLRRLAEQMAADAPAADRIGIADDLVERLETRTDGLRTAIGALFAGNPRAILIVVDQFEEIFTHSRTTSDSAGHHNAPAENLIANLLDAVEDPSGPVRVLITLRTDFVPHCLDYPHLRLFLESNQLLLGELGPEALREVIKFPARKVGAFFEKGLVEIILRDVHQQRGSLPLLQHALKELWQVRRGPWLTLEAYEKSGGVAGALRRRAQDTYEQKLKNEQQRAIARSIFPRLTTLGEGVRDSRRRVPREELFPYGVERRAVEEVLAVLSHNDARLIVVNDDNTVEVTHEALIHTWGTLREWIDSKRDQLRLLRRLTDSAREWEEAGNDAGYLYRGGRLEEVEKWPRSSDISLNSRELAFVQTSLAERRREDQQRRAQQQRELDGALRLAETERQARQRQRRLIGALVALLLLAGFVAAIAVREGSSARSAENTARAAEKKTSEVASRAHVSLARNSLEAGKDAEALAHLAQALRLNPRDYEATAFTGALLAQTSSVRPSAALTGHDSYIGSARFSPDGQRLLTASADHTARLWNAATRQPLGAPLRHGGNVESAQFSPDGLRVVTASDDETARIWDAATGQPLSAPMQHEGWVYSAQFSPNGQQVVTASADGTARIWEATAGRPPGAPMKHGDPVRSAQFSPDGLRVVTASEDRSARIWDAATGQPLGAPMKHEGLVYSAQFSPDGQRVVTASADGTARIWDAAAGLPLSPPLRHEGSVVSAQFSPDGQRVVTASRDKTARVWDAATGQPLTSSLRHEGPVHSAQFSPDGQRVVTSSDDKTARIWDAATGQPLSTSMRHEGAVLSAQFSPDGQWLITSSEDKMARLWSASAGRPISASLWHGGGVFSAQFSPNGRRVLTASEDWAARQWDETTGAPFGQAMRHGYMVCSAQFSRDGQRLLTASADGTARIWDAATGQPLSAPLRHDGSVFSAQFSPDGRHVVTASWDKTARLWDTATGQPLSVPLRHQGSVLSARFSPDGQRVLTASDDRTARVWNVDNGQPLSAPLRHAAKVNSAQFSPDGQRVLTASADFTARLWATASGQPLGTPLQHGDKVNSAQFSLDGQHIVTASDDKTARLWDTATNQPMGAPMKHEGKVLSAQFSPDGHRVATTSDDRTTRLWDAATGQPLSAPLRHGGKVNSAQFSPDGQRVVTACEDKTARIWDLPTITERDTVEDIRLLADLAEATGGLAIQVSAQSEVLKELTPEEVTATCAKIAGRFPGQHSKLTPLQRLMEWSVAERMSRTISPFSGLTIAEWLENNISLGTLDALRAAILVAPANALLAGHFGRALADHALVKGIDAAEARRDRGEAEFQTRRGLQLAPESAEVKALRAETAKLLQLNLQ